MGHPLNGERALTIPPLAKDEDEVGRGEVRVMNKLIRIGTYVECTKPSAKE